MLKKCLQFNVSDGSVSSINPISTDVFWPRNHRRGAGVKLCPPYFFLDRELLLIDLKPGTNTKKLLKSFQKKIFNWRHHILAVYARKLAFTCFCQIAKLRSVFFFAFQLFAGFNVFSIRALLYQHLLWECFTSFS